MIINKQYIVNLMEETCSEFNKKVMKTDSVEIKFVDKENFLEDAKKAFTNKLMIDKGIFKDFDREYPSFLVVYPMDKNPISLLLTGTYKISICYDIAREKLKPFNAKQVRAYLKHAFAHEIAHILEDKIIKERDDLWQKALEQGKGVEQLAK